MATALETIEERCRIAMDGIPNETRKAFPDGTTIFERVLPGPDRMYPDTDSAPIPIEEKIIERLQSNLPVAVDTRMQQLKDWKIPSDTHQFLLRHNLLPLLELIIDDCNLNPQFVGCLLGHTLKQAILTLPEKYRVVLVLRDVEGFSTEESAEILNLTPSNIKVRLHRARLFLRDQLKAYFKDE